MDRREAHDYVVAVRFVLQSNYTKYIAELSNDPLDYENKYPRSLAAAYEILHIRGQELTRPDHQIGMSFTNVEVQMVPGIDGRVYPQVECFGCHEKGNRLVQCPEAAAAGAAVNGT